MDPAGSGAPPLPPSLLPFLLRRRATLASSPSSSSRPLPGTTSRGMAGQPPQAPEDDFFDQFFSLTNSLSAAGAGGRPAGDQPFSLALSLDAAAASEASGSGNRLGDDAEGGKAERETVQLPGLFPPVFGGGVQPPHVRASPPPQVFHVQ